MNASILIVGIGSAHGDDQIGWRVAECLAATTTDAAVSIRTARSPGELLGWLEEVDRLIVCDACQNLGAPGAIRRWVWPDAQLASLGSSGSHDFGLADVLALAERLCRLPKDVVVWSAEGEPSVPNAPLSSCGQAAAARLIYEISQELSLQVSSEK